MGDDKRHRSPRDLYNWAATNDNPGYRFAFFDESIDALDIGSIDQAHLAIHGISAAESQASPRGPAIRSRQRQPHFAEPEPAKPVMQNSRELCQRSITTRGRDSIDIGILKNHQRGLPAQFPSKVS